VPTTITQQLLKVESVDNMQNWELSLMMYLCNYVLFLKNKNINTYQIKILDIILHEYCINKILKSSNYI